jgi:stage II sporulation protein D
VVRALDRSADWGVVRSALFQARERSGRLALRGTGHGHGVGLCQRGAARMARRGAGAEEILARYFPRAACVKK